MKIIDPIVESRRIVKELKARTRGSVGLKYFKSFLKNRRSYSKEPWYPYAFCNSEMWAEALDKEGLMNFPENLSETEVAEINGELTNLIFEFDFFIPFFYTQNIFQFNKTLIEELLKTEFDGTLPADILKKLPFFNIYLDLRESPFEVTFRDEKINVYGFWAFFTYSNAELEEERNENNNLALNFVLNSGESLNRTGNLPMVSKDFDMILMRQLSLVEKLGRSAFDEKGNIYSIKDMDIIKKNFLEDNALIKKMLPFLLYLVSKEPDVLGELTFQESCDVKLIKGNREKDIMPPRQPRVRKIGYKIGPKLEAFRQKEKTEECVSGERRPHMRCGHWHKYWIGPRKSDSREQIIRWLFPTIVGA